jgi:hypothetical protein
MKTFNQFISELTQTQINTAVSAEKNIKHSFNNPGHQAPGYKYGGRMAPSRTDPTKEVPEQTRSKQDLQAAQIRSQQRQR